MSSLTTWKLRQGFEEAACELLCRKQQQNRACATMSHAELQGRSTKTFSLMKSTPKNIHGCVPSAERVAISQHQQWYLGAQNQTGIQIYAASLSPKLEILIKKKLAATDAHPPWGYCLITLSLQNILRMAVLHQFKSHPPENKFRSLLRLGPGLQPKAIINNNKLI